MRLLFSMIRIVHMIFTSVHIVSILKIISKNVVRIFLDNIYISVLFGDSLLQCGYALPKLLRYQIEYMNQGNKKTYFLTSFYDLKMSTDIILPLDQFLEKIHTKLENCFTSILLICIWFIMGVFSLCNSLSNSSI